MVTCLAQREGPINPGKPAEQYPWPARRARCIERAGMMPMAKEL